MASKTLFITHVKKCNFRTKLHPKRITITAHTSRRNSTAVAEKHSDEPPSNTESDVTDGTARDDVTDGHADVRGAPILVVPHFVKKAYHVHETQTTPIPRLFHKYKWLTKTVSSQGIPYRHVNTDVTDNEMDELVAGVHDSLFQTVAYTKEWRTKMNPKFIPERLKYNMLSNFLRLAMSTGAGHLKPENSYLYHEPVLETHWFRDYKFYQTKFRPDFVLRTKDGFDMIEEPTELTPDQLEHLPGPFGPYDMNMYRHSIVHLLNRPAMDNVKLNPIKHCHTTIMQRNRRLVTDEQHMTLGLSTMFAQLAAQAQSAGVLHGTELEKPLVTQCVATNGHQIIFMVYQLNTLHLLDDKGVWNRCWYSPLMPMFERVPKNPRAYLVHEDAEPGAELKGFNPEFAKLFINFINNNTRGLS